MSKKEEFIKAYVEAIKLSAEIEGVTLDLKISVRGNTQTVNEVISAVNNAWDEIGGNYTSEITTTK